MKTDKISIIVCCYNTEKYIKKCIDSILSQTYVNLEIIIIDDGSKDNTYKILKEYNDTRIILEKNKKNMGLAYSRNLGIEKSTGKYLGFIDSDDYIPKDYYEKLYNSLKNDRAELSICDINIIYENKNNSSERVAACSGIPNIKNIFDNGLVSSCCNKLIKKDLIKYSFDVGKINEDIAVIIPTLATAKKISYATDTFYNYIQRGSSIQNSAFSKKRLDIFSQVDLTISRIGNCKDYDMIVDALVFHQLIVLLLYIMPKIKNYKERVYYTKEISKRLKKYDISNNIFYEEFLNNCNKKRRLYWKTYMFCVLNHMSFISALLISLLEYYKKIRVKNVIKENISYDDLKIESEKQKDKQPNEFTICAIIPNYNYSNFLKERVYSILYQTKKIDKIIILDDCSKDNSKEEMEKIKSIISKNINIELIYNEKNSGSPFKQWAKGMKLAETDYVWICEADDYCECTFLEEVCKPINSNKDIMISYSNTSFIDKEGNVIAKNIIPQIDIMKSGHWDHNFINNGLNEIKDYAFLNCTIPNVSGAIIKNGDYKEAFKLISSYHQAGDWLFYISLMKQGDIAFSSKKLNYYRVHGNNVSSVFNKKAHLNEIKNIHKYLKDNFKLSTNASREIEARYEYLIRTWGIDEKD